MKATFLCLSIVSASAIRESQEETSIVTGHTQVSTTLATHRPEDWADMQTLLEALRAEAELARAEASAERARADVAEAEAVAERGRADAATTEAQRARAETLAVLAREEASAEAARLVAQRIVQLNQEAQLSLDRVRASVAQTRKIRDEKRHDMQTSPSFNPFTIQNMGERWGKAKEAHEEATRCLTECEGLIQAALHAQNDFGQFNALISRALELAGALPGKLAVFQT